MSAFKKGDIVYLNNPGYSVKEYGYQIQTSGKYVVVELAENNVLADIGFAVKTYKIVRARKNSKHIFEVNRKWLEERSKKIN
jgi:hypothetical protein